MILCPVAFTPPNKFAGYEYDSETGNYYAFARYYNPRLGRFMTPDPAGQASADPLDPQSWNLYTYVLNSPTDATDPTGLSPWSGICMVAGRPSGAVASGGGCGYGPTEGGGTCMVDGGAMGCGMVGMMVTSASIGSIRSCSDYVSCVVAMSALILDQIGLESMAKPAFSLKADPNGSTQNCVQGA